MLEPLAAAGRTVLAVDLRGQYQSPAAPDRAGYSPAALAADVLTIADLLGREAGGVHVVGHSLGGLIARDAVLQRAAGFMSLTLLGSGPGPIAGGRATALRDALAVLDPSDGALPDDRPQLAALVRQAWHDQHEPQARAEGTDEHIIAFLKERMLRTCPLHLIVLARYLLTGPDRTEELAGLVAGGLARPGGLRRERRRVANGRAGGHGQAADRRARLHPRRRALPVHRRAGDHRRDPDQFLERRGAPPADGALLRARAQGRRARRASRQRADPARRLVAPAMRDWPAAWPDPARSAR